MMELAPTFTDPNFDGYDGPNRIIHSPMAYGSQFARRGGKAVDLHHYYQSATANSSNLAGFAEVEEMGIAGGRPPVSITNGMEIPVNFDLGKSFVFPTTGRVATETDVGKDFDIYVDANGAQFINMGASVNGVLRVSRLAAADGAAVSCEIPPDLRYGNR